MQPSQLTHALSASVKKRHHLISPGVSPYLRRSANKNMSAGSGGGGHVASRSTPKNRSFTAANAGGLMASGGYFYRSPKTPRNTTISPSAVNSRTSFHT